VGAVISDNLRPRVGVCGTRTFSDWRLLYAKMDRLTRGLGRFFIVTGAGRHTVWRRGKELQVGADWFAEQWAYSRMCPVQLFHPDTARIRPPACYHARNREMVDYLRDCAEVYMVAFWDGRSPGTRSVLELCHRAKILTRIIRYQE
jgi:hypothetical protein